MVAQLIEASTRRKAAEMRYFSVSSNRQKDYLVHPYVVEYSDGGLYLRAYVPEYDEVRLFAVERIKKIRITEQSFTPVKAVSDEDFDPSLGLGTAKPERVVLEFSARVAPYVRERVWHQSQRVDELPGGGLRLSLKVSRDWALHGWVLSWGPHVHVTAPATLAQVARFEIDDVDTRSMPTSNAAPAMVAMSIGACSMAPSPMRPSASRSPGSRSARSASSSSMCRR